MQSETPIGPYHDLEAHISGLRQLDEYRQRAKIMARQGKLVFLSCAEPLLNGDSFTAESFLDEGLDVACAVQDSATASDLPAFTNILDKAASQIALEELNAYSGSILASSRLLQLLSSNGKHSASRSSFLCWYTLIRELFSATAPDWAIGAARAGTGKFATISAYATGHALHGILGFAHALDTTADLVEEISSFGTKVNDVEQSTAPEDWRTAELERLRSSHQISVKPIWESTILDLTNPPDCINPSAYLDSIDCMLDERLKAAALAVNGAIDEIRAYRAREESDANAPYDRRLTRNLNESSTGHTIALAALTRTHDDIQDALQLLQLGQREALAAEFRNAATRVRNGISPAHHYLRSVIDKQLGAMEEASSERNPLELAFAALAYAELLESKVVKKALLTRALTRICEQLDEDGNLPHAQQPYHTLDDGNGWIIKQANVLWAVIRLMRHLKAPLSESLTGKVINFFEQTSRPHSKDGKILQGWCFNFGDPSACDAISTGLAVTVLTEFETLINETINQIVLEHFSVKYPSQISLGLDELYYPDYGLRFAPKNIEKDSVAQQLQKMRRHVVLQDSPAPSFSLALYGPAGTGKTTLIEALAKSCDVPLVEVTPSDIAKRGEAEIELRARAVFEALAMLTKTIILFDEFDPILRRRSADENRPFNMFSFLTPGMLPKLKSLHSSAKENGVAYALITNLVGTLDEAAVREGRFDAKYGVFPPDPVSRYGRFLVVNKHETSSFSSLRVAEVIRATKGLGMTAMASRKGWYRPLGSEKAEGSLTGYVKSVCSLPPMPDPEEKFGDKLKGTGQHAEREYLAWGWLTDWENACDSNWHKATAEDDGADFLDAMMGWPSTTDSIDAFDTRTKKLQSLLDASVINNSPKSSA